jgi:hypothetical protein
MALLFIDSFDHYDGDHVHCKYTSGFFYGGIVVGKGRCGTNCMGLGLFTAMNKGLVFGSATGTIGFAFYIVKDRTAFSISPVYLNGIGGTHCVVTYHFGDGSLEVYRETNNAWVSLGRTAPDLIRMDTWYYLELQYFVHASAGSMSLRINNVEHLTFTGKTVGSAGGVDYGADLRSVTWRCPSNCEWYMDDLYILDSTGPAPWNTFLGDVRVEYLRPRAAGTYQEWTPVGAASHWQAVDDLYTPDDDATYVSANAPDLRDTNLYRPTGLPSGPVYGAQLSLLVRKTEAGPRILAPMMNGAVGPSYAPSEVSYTYLHQPYGPNPATGTQWTIAEINAIDAGVKVVS